MKQLVFILLGIIFLSACRQDKQKDDSWSDDMNIKIYRYDRLQYEAAALNSFSALQKMSTDCPQATKLLIEDVLAIGSVNAPNINEQLCAYYSDTVLLKLMEDAVGKFKDMHALEKELTSGFQKLKKEIPSVVIPRIYSQISALNQSVVVGDSLLGFSIDKYMGQDYPLYKRYYYSYQRRSMTPDRIIPDCFTSYLISLYPFLWEEGHRTLLDIMIYHGKIEWGVAHLLDYDKSGKDLLGYTKEEVEWCHKNKAKLWEWMTEGKHLSSTDPMLIRAYTHPDPSVVFKGEKIPPLIGIWMGIQLVDAYMTQHKEVTLRQLLERTDYHVLLDEINFKP